MQPIYLALLEDEKSVINKSSLELINAIPDNIKYLIKKEFDRHVKVGINEDNLYAYTAVDLDGKYKPIELTNFIVVDLGTDYFGKYASERHTIVKEKRSGECRKFHSVGESTSFLHTLVALLKKLENAGSWEVVDKFKQLEDIEKENEQLKVKVRNLEKLLVDRPK